MTSAASPHTDVAARLASFIGPERIRTGVALAPYTTFNIGGPADLFVEVQSADELARAVSAARDTGIPWFVLGLGANILVGDKGFRGLVIRNIASHARWSDDGHVIAEVFDSCDILAEDGARRTVDASYVDFGYDDTVFHHRRDIVLTATLRLTQGDPAAMRRVMEENLSWRGARHPWLDWFPSAGSIFKKIEGVGAGRLIDQCGLKGFRHGDAQISTIHANIIVNLGRATAADVRAVISTAQRRVQEQHGYRLEPEIGFIGEF